MTEPIIMMCNDGIERTFSSWQEAVEYTVTNLEREGYVQRNGEMVKVTELGRERVKAKRIS